MKRCHILLLVLLVHPFFTCANSQTLTKPRSVVVRSGSLKLRALLWRPAGHGPFPAVLFSPRSGQNPPPHSLGRLFARHGYVFLAFYRRGQGPSSAPSEESGHPLILARATHRDHAAKPLQ